MDVLESEIGERARAIWASNGGEPDTELADWLANWRTARAELVRGRALVRQLRERPATELGHLLRTVLDTSRAAIHVKDSRGHYLLVNGRFEDLHRVSLAGRGPTTDDDLFPPDQAATRRARDLQVIAAGVPAEFEEVIPGADGPGDERALISLVFPLAVANGIPYAVGGISTDVTEQQRSQRCLVIQHAVTRALAGSVTATEAGSAVLGAICQPLGWDAGLYWKADATANRLQCAEAWYAPRLSGGAFEQMSRGMALPPGVGLAGRVWATGQPVWIENIGVADNFPRAAVALEDGLHGACGFPVRTGGGVEGVIEFFSREVRRPDRDLTRVMTDIGGQVSLFLEGKRVQLALHERDREFSLARAIQFGLLPPRSPTLAGLALGGAYYPAQETGGDYFDYIPGPDGSVTLAIGDASGHGIGAALIIAQARAYVRARAATDADVGRVLTSVNRHLAADVPEGHFITLFLARLDAPTRTLTYSSAGHGPGYVFDDRGEVRVVLGSTNFPLGIGADTDYPVAPPVLLRPGETVLLLTDGIYEASSPAGEQFGLGRVLATVRACRGAAPDDILTTLLRAVRAFSPGAQVDDMTAIIIKVDDPGHATATG